MSYGRLGEILESCDADEADIYLYTMSRSREVGPYGDTRFQPMVAFKTSDEAKTYPESGFGRRICEDDVQVLADQYETAVSVHVLGDCDNRYWEAVEQFHPDSKGGKASEDNTLRGGWNRIKSVL